MKKKYLILVGGAVALVVVLYFGASWFLGSLVKAGVNHFGPRLTQTNVVLEHAELSPLSGAGTLTGLVVGNPKGWLSNQAFAFGKIHVEVEPASLFRSQIVVQEIDIEDASFDYETRFVSTNLGELLSQIEGPPADSSSSAEATTSGGRPLRFVVRHFILRNGRVTFGVGPTAITLAMPPIELRNLGTDGSGITSVELARVLMRTLAQNVVAVTANAATKTVSALSGATGDRIKKGFSDLKNLLKQ